VLHMAVITVCLLFVFEMVARLLELENSYPLIIFIVELFLCNIALLLATLKFLKLSNELFDYTNFTNEKDYFK
jgi:hypothetical protein